MKAIENIQVEGIDFADYPDFCDAFIASAERNGTPLNEKELEELNEDKDFVYECINKQLY
jgi:hypothetical protein